MKFEKAKPNIPWLKIAMMGFAGAGKTYTSLRLGEGLAKKEGKKMAVIDTDPGSPASLYAKPLGKFEFDTVKPTSAEELIEIIENFDTNIYGVLILDTITWLWRVIQTMDNVGRMKIERTKADTTPFGAWHKLKTLYREVLLPVINLQCHAIVTGRETVDYDLSSPEIHAVGFKMIAEKETPFEANLWIRLIQCRSAPEQAIPQAHLAEVLRDRTGILQGKIFENMTYEHIEPLVKILCGELRPEPDEAEQAIKDYESLDGRLKKKMEKFEENSLALRLNFEKQIHAARTLAELEPVVKAIKKTKERDMTEKDKEILRKLYKLIKENMNNG